MDKPPPVVPKSKSSSMVVGKPAGQAEAPPPAKPVSSPPISSRPKWYRRKYLVYPQFQMTLILLNSVVTTLLFSLVVYLVLKSHLNLEAFVRQTRIPAQSLFLDLMTQQTRSLIFYMMVALGVSVSSTAIATLLISHRMAGPIIRLRGYFNEISKTGEFPKELKFREGDFFLDLPPTINAAFLALMKRWHK